jgi:hypothetical protein
MKNSIDFYKICIAELFKTRKNLSVWLLLLFPLFFSMVVFLYIFFKAQEIPYNPWIFTGSLIFRFYSFLYPLIIALTVYSLINIEYKSSGFKHLFSIPASGFYIYIAKIINMFLFILCSVIVAYISYKFGCVLLHKLRPELGFQDYDSALAINLFFLKLFLSLICITLIQFLLSLRYPNFIVSTGFALFVTIFIIVFHFEYSYLFPYKNIDTALMDLMFEDNEFLKKEVIVELIYIPILFVTDGYFFTKIRA